MNPGITRPFRTLLVLGRAANLPAVWSNCLAGWWLAGGGNFWKLPLLLLGMSALCVGGMFLNDAFDVEFDRQRRAARPIPAGKIPLGTVWRFGLAGLALGIFCLLFLGKVAAVLALVLVLCILIYNAAHRVVTVSPWLLGACRFWVYVIAGTTGVNGLGGWAVWCGAAMMLYVAGLSFVARWEKSRGPVSHWPLLLLVAPIALALLMDQGDAQKPARFVSLIFLLWTARCVRTFFQAGLASVGRISSGLVAGIVLADWLAIAPQCPQWLGGTLLLLFVTTLLAQRFAPTS